MATCGNTRSHPDCRAILKGYADGREAKAGIASWIAFYNVRRLHQAHGYRTPMAVWRAA
ncbi:transposase [Bradyrhizobium sp. 191]|nr:transposase [Bradyrhizobium sp. 191]